MRNDTFTGGEHYWIGFDNGTSVVYEEQLECNTIVFRGHYEECVNYINNLLIENVDYDLNL